MKLEEISHLMPPIKQEEKSKLIVGPIKESAKIIPVIDATLNKYHHGQFGHFVLWRQHDKEERYELKQSLAWVYGVVEREQIGEKTHFLAFTFGIKPNSNYADTVCLVDIREIQGYETEKKY